MHASVAIPAWFKVCIMATVAVLAPLRAQLSAAFCLVMLDLITGVWAAVKRGEKITSSGLGRTVAKVVVYQGALLTAFLAQTFLIGDALPALALVSSFIGVTELTSVLENLSTISGKDILKVLISKLSSKNAAQLDAVPGRDDRGA